MKEATGASPDAGHDARGDYGRMRSRQAASSRQSRSWVSTRVTTMSNHIITVGSLQDSEPLFRRPTRVVYTSFYTVYSAPISRAVGTPAVECLREDTFSMDPPALFKTR